MLKKILDTILTFYRVWYLIFRNESLLLNHRIIFTEWFGLERPRRSLSPSLSRDISCTPGSSMPQQTQPRILPRMVHPSFSEQPVPMPHCPHSKCFLPCIWSTSLKAHELTPSANLPHSTLCNLSWWILLWSILTFSACSYLPTCLTSIHP